jgi:cell division protein FtsZ
MSVELKPRILVFGVGGAGGNAVNNMIQAELPGVDFIVANTDAQALSRAKAETLIQLGMKTTKGLGAGSRPEIGAIAAEESIEEISRYLDGVNMVFIAAGMGGGTGTGAAPVIARIAREKEILTVGVVTKPFSFEGPKRMAAAEQGVADLRKHVDTLIVIPNQNMFRVANVDTSMAEAFAMADAVLDSGVRGIIDLMVKPGLVNLDFADVRTVMAEMGSAMMGTGEASGETRALDAARAAIDNPLLDDVCLRGAKGVLINITGGPDMRLFEVDEAANYIRDQVDDDANIVFGSAFSEELEGKIRVSVVATGIETASDQITAPARPTRAGPIWSRPAATTAAPARPATLTAAPEIEDHGPAEHVGDTLEDAGADITEEIDAAIEAETEDTRADVSVEVHFPFQEKRPNFRDVTVIDEESEEDDTPFVVNGNAPTTKNGIEYATTSIIDDTVPYQEPKGPQAQAPQNESSPFSIFKWRSKSSDQKSMASAPTARRSHDDLEDDELDIPTFLRQTNR